MKQRIKHIILVLFAALPISVAAQESADGGRVPFDRLFAMVMNYLGEDSDEETVDAEELYANLLLAYQNPIEWNGATRNSLDQLLFLPDILVENLLYYADVYGPVHSIAELQMVPDIELPMLRILPNIMVVAEEADTALWTDAFGNLRHSITARADATLEPTGKADYQGVPFRPMLRYDIQAGANFRAGVVMESDAKEPWWGQRTAGFDMYRFYAQADNLPAVGRVVVGAYRAAFGKGLLFGTMAYGNRMQRVLNTASTHRAPSGYGGVSESPSLFGVASSSVVGITPQMSLDISALYSYSALDADTAGGEWTSISSTGYHRTPTEQSKKYTLGLNTVGADVSLSHRIFNLGATFYGGFFALPAVPTARYAATDFAGNRQLAASLHYAVKYKLLRLSGEVAATGVGAVATINTLHIAPSTSYRVVITHRYISPRYHLFWAHAPLAVGSTTAQHGASVAFQIPLARATSLALLADAYKPLRSTTVTSSSAVGYEMAAELRSAAIRSVSLSAHFRYKQRPRWVTDATHIMAHTGQEHLGLASLTANYTISPAVTMKSVFQTNVAQNRRINSACKQPTWGFNLYHDVGYFPQTLPFDLRSRISFCHAPQWANRFYAYEYDVSASAYAPAIYGTSLRWYLVARCRLPFGLDISARVAQTLFFDRNSISSGMNKINSNHKTDIHIYLAFNV